MNKTLCQYAIVRFSPYVETGEFANVGILMMAPKDRYFGFKLLTRRYSRITKFFKELEPKVFLAATRNLKDELERIHHLLKAHGFDKRLKENDINFANNIFEEILRPRETIIRFGESRAVLTENPKETLNELFAYYVERDFVNKEYHQTVMEKGLRKMLYKAHLGEQFNKQKVGDDEYTVTFPFVKLDDKTPTKVIKPLNLGQDETTKILEAGGTWQFRLNELKKRQVIPNKILFAVDGPKNKGKCMHAYHEALEMLNETGVTVIPFVNKGEILEFAQN